MGILMFLLTGNILLYITLKKVYFKKKFLYVNSICDQSVADNEMLHIFQIFYTFNKVSIM